MPTDHAPAAGPEFCASRRDLLRGLASIGVTVIGAGVLVACGGDDDPAATVSSSAAATAPAGREPATTAPAGSPTAAASAAEGGSAAEGVPTSQVPVGEARVVDLGGQRLVVAQPKAGTFVAFSSRCTHQGTEVQSAGGLELRCPNHGSRFDGATGDVEQGPASSPLPSVQITVDGDRILPA